jgi:sigma-B regulation protein RsbU (phosphoserine phosphatase)
MVDREQCWLCPFCAALLDHLRLNPRTLVHDVQIETIWLHLAEECADYRAGKGVRPITELTEIVRRTNQDKLSASRTTATALATRVIQLQDQLKGAEELEESVKVAAERQRRLLPSKVPEIPGALAALGYWPSNRVSGDFYDFLDLGEGRFALLIGDVAGHGIEAGILMGVAKKVVSIRMRDCADPSLALQMANRDIYPDLDRKTFVSALLATYDSATREFTYVRAGHNPPVLFNPDRPKQFTKLEASGLVLGLDPGPRFNQVMARDTVQLRAGDTLAFYTDGLIEAQNATGEEFGLHRVYHQLRRQSDAHPQDVLNGLYEQLNTFREGVPQEDDVTAIILRLQ